MSTHAPTNSDWPPPAYGWYVVLILSFANIVSFIDRLIMSLLVDPIKTDLALSDTQVSWLLGFAFVLFYAVIGLPMGRFADRHNRKRIISVGVVLWTLATAVCSMAQSFWQLFFFRMSVGIGEATLSPSTYSIIADYFPRDKLARPISTFSAAGYVGGGIALLVGAFVVSLVKTSGPVTLPFLGTLYSWQLTFLIVAAPGFLVWLLVLTIREPIRRGMGAPRLSGAAGPAESIPLREVLGFLYRERRVFGAIFGGFSTLAILGYGTFSWVPTFFLRVHGVDYAQAGFIYGFIFLVFGPGGVIAGGWITDRLIQSGKKDANLRVAMISAICLFPFAVAFPLMPNEYASFALLVPATFFGSVPFGVGSAALPVITPNRMRGQVVALYMFVANLVSLGLGPVFVALFTDKVFHDEAAVNYSLSSVAAIAVPLGVFILWLGLKPFREAVIAADHRDGAMPFIEGEA